MATNFRIERWRAAVLLRAAKLLRRPRFHENQAAPDPSNEQSDRRIEEEAIAAFFASPRADWPATLIQRRMQSSGG